VVCGAPEEPRNPSSLNASFFVFQLHAGKYRELKATVAMATSGLRDQKLAIHRRRPKSQESCRRDLYRCRGHQDVFSRRRFGSEALSSSIGCFGQTRSLPPAGATSSSVDEVVSSIETASSPANSSISNFCFSDSSSIWRMASTICSPHLHEAQVSAPPRMMHCWKWEY
jgi:hypothetical protein